jgi:hypothetical protein
MRQSPLTSINPRLILRLRFCKANREEQHNVLASEFLIIDVNPFDAEDSI